MIDPSRLPRRALVDNNVLSHALRPSTSTPSVQTAICREFLTEVHRSNGRILICAPVMAEFMRKDGKSFPRLLGAELVAFDAQAANVLGMQFPASVLKTIATANGWSKDLIKYDAMIVACALRHNADVIVSFDPDIGKLCERLNPRFAHASPDDYQTQPALIPSSGASRTTAAAAAAVGLNSRKPSAGP